MLYLHFISLPLECVDVRSRHDINKETPLSVPLMGTWKREKGGKLPLQALSQPVQHPPVHSLTDSRGALDRGAVSPSFTQRKQRLPQSPGSGP